MWRRYPRRWPSRSPSSATCSTLGIVIAGAEQDDADDVIGTLATRATGPVDVVTGDRYLFQLIDDAADVRVVYTARGMSALDVLTEAAIEAKYGILPRQYADFAVMRGDASDGLPGVASVSEKTAAARGGGRARPGAARNRRADPGAGRGAAGAGGRIR